MSLKFVEQQIFASVKDAMQAADELGGSDTAEDYAQLMDAIIAEATRRRTAALAQASSLRTYVVEYEVSELSAWHPHDMQTFVEAANAELALVFKERRKENLTYNVVAVYPKAT